MSSAIASTSLGGKEHTSISPLDCNIDTNASQNKNETTNNAIQPTSNNGISNNGIINNNNGTEYPAFIRTYDVSRSAPHRQSYPQQYIPSSSSESSTPKKRSISIHMQRMLRMHSITPKTRRHVMERKRSRLMYFIRGT